MNHDYEGKSGQLHRSMLLGSGFRISDSETLPLPGGGALMFWEVEAINSVILVWREGRTFTGVKMRPGNLEGAVNDYRRKLRLQEQDQPQATRSIRHLNS